MTIDWTAILALITACGSLCTGAVFVVRLVVRAEISKLSETYLPRRMADERHHGIDGRLKGHEQRLKHLEAK